MTERSKAFTVLGMNTLAFTVCFAVWMMNGVLITFLVESRVYSFTQVQIGWLLGIPVLTGSLMRLPVGLLTDRFGGRIVYPLVMLSAAAGALAMSFADSYTGFVIGSLGFGLAGTGFAVGIAYTSVWFKQQHQGTALGVFGVGNAGSAITSMAGPLILRALTRGGNLDAWRTLPRIYAAALLVMTVLFLFTTFPKRVAHAGTRTLRQQLAPLAVLRVWRFGLYYFLVFGGFVALAQWLIPYYLSVYGTSLAMAGMLAAIFSLPSGLIRALGGWMSDKLGARTTMYWVLGFCVLGCLMLVIPKMDITSPGESVVATGRGVVTAVSADAIVVDHSRRYPVRPPAPGEHDRGSAGIFPRSSGWQEPVVKIGDHIVRKQLLARGITRIRFDANIWVFTFLVFLVGIAMGIGKAAVYKHIPEYFPRDVGVVGGLVGVIGGLGGFVCPILFGYLLRATGLWTSCWLLLFVLSVVCLVWMHAVVKRLTRPRAIESNETHENVMKKAGFGHGAEILARYEGAGRTSPQPREPA